jgi:hypothetical protein
MASSMDLERPAREWFFEALLKFIYLFRVSALRTEVTTLGAVLWPRT